MSLISLPAFLTRRREDTPMPDTTDTQTSQQATDVLMRFLTQGGAEVHVTTSGRHVDKDHHWKCQGCDDNNGKSLPLYYWEARNDANAHAAGCRAMPKSEA
jgi:hypothetical protein